MRCISSSAMPSSRTKVAVIATVLFVGGLTVPATAHAGDFELGKYVPADVHFYGHWNDSPARARLMKPYEDAMVKFFESGALNDILELATMELSEEERGQAMAIINQVLEILGTPAWEKLFTKEAAFAFKLVMPFPEYVFLFRVPHDEVAARLGEFRSTFEQVSQFAPDQLVVSNESREGTEITTLMLGPDAPFSISAASTGDVVMLTTSSRMRDEALSLGAGHGAGITGSDHYKKAFANLPAPQDGLVYFDLSGYIDFFRSIFAMTGMDAGPDPNAQGALSIVMDGLNELGRLGPLAVSEHTVGDRMFADVHMGLQPTEGTGFIEKLIANQPPVSSFSKLVPAGAKSFYLTSGIDFAAAYDTILETVRSRIPAAEEGLAMWEGMQEQAGFHLRNDLLSWLGGGGGWATVPSEDSICDTVFFLTVKDEDRARELIGKCIGMIEGYVESRGHDMSTVPMQGVDGFSEVTIAAIPFVRPAFGFREGTLILGSAEAVKRVAMTEAGSHPGIMESPRFAALGEPPENVVEVYYQDLEDSLKQLSEVVGVIGFVMSLLPEEHDTRPVIRVGHLLGKVSTLLRDLDLGLDYAAWTKWDAETHSWRGRVMTRVKPPKKSF